MTAFSTSQPRRALLGTAPALAFRVLTMLTVGAQLSGAQDAVIEGVAGNAAVYAAVHAAAAAAMRPAAPVALAPDVRLYMPGSSRFAADIAGRDTVQRHLATMGLDWTALRNRTADFPLAADEAGWLVQLVLPNDRRPVTMLLAATRDIDAEIVRIELFIDDEGRLARLAPRDDGVTRTSLATQRNLRQARVLHGSGGNTRFLAASGARVLAILDNPLLGRPPQLVQYRFDAAGRVSFLGSASPLASPCSNSSGSSATSAYTITPP